MKITDIEVIPIHPRLAQRYDNPAGRARMGGIDSRLVFKIQTHVGTTIGLVLHHPVQHSNT